MNNLIFIEISKYYSNFFITYENLKKFNIIHQED